eukprot:1332937-Karenia_brevis.AAC.1
MSQAVLLHKMWTCIAASPVRPTFTALHELWDETGEKITLNVVPGTTRHQRASIWQIMVMRIEVMIGWLHGQGPASADDMVITMDVVIPPIPLLGTSSEDMFSGLHHGVTKSIRKMVDRLINTGNHKWDLREYDGAAANDRLNWFLARRSKAQGRMTYGSGC